MAIRFDYFRGGRHMSPEWISGTIFRSARQRHSAAGYSVLSEFRPLSLFPLLALGAAFALPAVAQYPGQLTKSTKDAPELRSIAVLEWTGEAGKPKASRLVPVAVLDGGELQDGGIYLARPQPLALGAEVEYELLQDGKPRGLFDIRNAGQEQGAWVGYGAWKPMPQPKKVRQAAKPTADEDDSSDRPVLHRKHHSGDTDSDGSGNPSSTSSAPAEPSDPDRPTLHKKTSSGDASSDSSDSSASSPASTSDPDRPTLHKKTSDDSSSSGNTSASSDPDRPALKKNKKKEPEPAGYTESLPDVTDPDRPMLKRGKASADKLALAPSLMGVPPDMQQMVAVSDAKNRPEHLWDYAWSNPDDEAKMKASMEDIARQALGMNPPPRPAAAAARRTSSRKTAKPAPPAEPAPLLDEQFRVFELAYGSGATMVLSARTDAPAAQQKFVTLIAQPDLYGNVLVLLKSVTDSAHLDDTPRMRLVDAVDAMGDNRGELLFELRGNTQRQFALFRVLRGQAEKLFAGGGGEYGMQSRD